MKKYIVVAFTCMTSAWSIAQVTPPAPTEVKSSYQKLSPQPKEKPTIAPDYAMRRYGNNGKEGFVSDGIIYVSFSYNMLPIEYSDFMVARKGRKYGVIDRLEKIVVPFEYDEMHPLVYYRNAKTNIRYLLRKGDLYGIMKDKEGIVVPVEYKGIQQLSKAMGITNQSDMTGLFDIEGNSIQPFIYEKPLKPFGPYIKAVKNAKTGLINEKGEEVFPFQFDEMIRLIGENYIVVKNEGKMGIYNLGQKMVLDFDYSLIWPTKDQELVFVKKEDGQMGAFNTDMEEVLSCKWRNITELIPGFVRVADGSGKTGAWNYKGEELLPCKFSHIKCNGTIFLTQSSKGGTYASYDIKGQKIKDTPYIKLSTVEVEEYIVASKDGEKWGLLGKDGIELTPFIYDKIYVFGNSRSPNIRASRDGKFGRLDEKGKEFPSSFD